MKTFYLKTRKGQSPPRFRHSDFESAVTEANRLSELHDDEVEILEVVAKVTRKEVPVTKTISELTIVNTSYDDLPF